MTLNALYQTAHNEWVPKWFDLFFDEKTGAFHERLASDGTPLNMPRRLVSLCRQIMVYAQHGDPRFAPAIEGTFQYIEERFSTGLAGAYVFAEDDRHIDLYALSFLISACAATGRETLAEAVFEFIETHMAHPKGYAEKLDSAYRDITQKRRQNPHMHLLEAVQSMAQISSNARWRSIAVELLELFLGSFYQNGNLYEFFDENLQNPEDWLEAGHHAEWVWLLHRFDSDLSMPSARIPAIKHHLYDYALKGIDPQYGGVFNVQKQSADVIDANKRIWVQLETLRASVIMGDIQTQKNLIATIEEKYLPKSGLWIETWDKGFTQSQDYLSATTPYHIYPVLRSIRGV